MDSTDLAIARVDVHAVSEQGVLLRTDAVALEEPLEIRVGWGPLGERRQRTLTVTMRTPGHDAELAVGFLFSEGAIRGPADVVETVEGTSPDRQDGANNVVRVELHPGVELHEERLVRNFPGTASCGVCGKAALEETCNARDWANEGIAPGTDRGRRDGRTSRQRNS